MKIKKISKDIIQFSEKKDNIRDVSVVDIENYISKVDAKIAKYTQEIIVLNEVKELQQGFLDEFNKLTDGDSVEIESPEVNNEPTTEPITI